MSGVFERVPTGNPERHYFPLRPNKKFDCHIGELIPFKYFECIPGDKVKISQQSVVRFTPLVAPVMHEIYLYTWYFFVPTRILFKDEDNELYDKDKLLELFFGGGKDGTVDINLPKFTNTTFSKYSCADYLGYPLSLPSVVEGGAYKGVLKFPVRGYNAIYNSFFRDENLIDEVDLDNLTVQRVAWKKDYFTSSMPFQQRGASPLINLPMGKAPIMLDKGTGQFYTNNNDVTPNTHEYLYMRNDNTWNPGGIPAIYKDKILTLSRGTMAEAIGKTAIVGQNSTDNPVIFLRDSIDTNKSLLFADNNSVAPSININDIRLSFQAQRFLERNALAGVRYTEMLKAHFNVAPADEVLQRPQYLGGSKSPIMVSEVASTAETTSLPQGNLAGKGLNADINGITTYTAKEFGYIICLCAIRPELGYSAQGINRDLLRYSKFDFPFPAFMMLGERSVYNCEIYANTDNPMGTFGYQGMFNELRADNNQVAGGFRDTTGYSQWHMNRSFASLPNLGKDFIECQVDKRCFANTSADVRECLCTIETDCDFYRPIPQDAEPGLVDHIYGG